MAADPEVTARRRDCGVDGCGGNRNLCGPAVFGDGAAPEHFHGLSFGRLVFGRQLWNALRNLRVHPFLPCVRLLFYRAALHLSDHRALRATVSHHIPDRCNRDIRPCRAHPRSSSRGKRANDRNPTALRIYLETFRPYRRRRGRRRSGR